MFSRILDCHVHAEKREEIKNKLRDVLPVLQKQPGLVDVLGLVSDSDPNHFLSITLWESKADADRYHRESYDRVMEAIRPLLKTDPVLTQFRVETSTVHKLVGGKAA